MRLWARVGLSSPVKKTQCAQGSGEHPAANRGRRARRAFVAAVAAAAIGAVPSAVAVVTTGHQFAVSESGAATITIPIQVPRGIAGMEPQLSLNYSSGSGNGLLGVGWTLAGPSAITRCPKTVLFDNGVRGAVTFTNGDRFCLDGQRLEAVDPNRNNDTNYGASGTEYRTERDSLSRIIAQGSFASGAPLSFEVRTKSGLKMYFGLSANSRVMTNRTAALGPNTVNRWMLQRIADRNDNYVEFVYCGGEVRGDLTCTNEEGTSTWSGSKVLHYIQYTNRAASGPLDGALVVAFRYEHRPDQVQGFHAGSASRQTQRLAKIETYRNAVSLASAALVRRYSITYEPIEANGTGIRATNASRIEKIQESDASGATLEPLIFANASDSVFGMNTQHRASATQQPTGPIKPPPECGGPLLNRVRLMCK
jgi:hypothetical protein